MLKRALVGLLAVAVLGLAAGCAALDMVGNSAKSGYSMTGQYLVVSKGSVAGWVEVEAATPGDIHWGDSYDEASYTTITKAGTYGHYFRTEGVYAVRLIQNDVNVVDVAIAEIPHSGWYVRLARTEGNTIVATAYGPVGQTGWIVWGDTSLTTVSINYGGTTGLEWSHTYTAPGTYEVGIRGDVGNGGDQYKACFSITIGAQ